MSLTDAPGIITQLSTQLAACASWPGGSASNHWYPEADTTGLAAALAVLSESERRYTPYAAGAAGLMGGSLAITIHAPTTTGTIGYLESLGRSLMSELLAQQSGIPFQPANCGLCSDSTPGMEAAAQAIRSLTITLGYGLEA